MLWARMLAYVTGRVNQELLLGNEYLGTEWTVLCGCGAWPPGNLSENHLNAMATLWRPWSSAQMANPCLGKCRQYCVAMGRGQQATSREGLPQSRRRRGSTGKQAENQRMTPFENAFRKAEAVSNNLCHPRGSPQRFQSNFGPTQERNKWR